MIPSLLGRDGGCNGPEEEEGRQGEEEEEEEMRVDAGRIESILCRKRVPNFRPKTSPRSASLLGANDASPTGVDELLVSPTPVADEEDKDCDCADIEDAFSDVDSSRRLPSAVPVVEEGPPPSIPLLLLPQRLLGRGVCRERGVG